MKMINIDPFFYLDAMKIPMWGKSNIHKSSIYFPKPKLYPRLMVILEKKISEENPLAEKVFHGMLKVLPVSMENISIGFRIKDENDVSFSHTVSHTVQALLYWKPQYILILGESLGKEMMTSYSIDNVINIPYFITFHPEHLATFPQYKKEAYSVLLALKKQIEVGDNS